MPKIRAIEVQGFRAFGSETQSLELKGPMAVIWGSNSQGKTSLSEAIEFLLTGQTVRREFVASAAREFSGSLRNVHMSDENEVFVRAYLEDASGQYHTIERKLFFDYTGRDSCNSQLLIDGEPSNDLAALDIRLSQPPLEAPILMQHTLRYVVSTEPQKRADYFKALLELTDLETLRNAIFGGKQLLRVSQSQIGELYERCHRLPNISKLLSTLEEGIPSIIKIQEILNSVLEIILPDVKELPEALEDRTYLIKNLLRTRREKTFPLQAFNLGSILPPKDFDYLDWSKLSDFILLRDSIDQKIAYLSPLFEAVLKIPALAEAKTSIDCPLCETAEALTPERIAVIKEFLRNSEAFQNSAKSAIIFKQDLITLVNKIEQSVHAGKPKFLNWSKDDRKKRGFTEDAISSLLDDATNELLDRWRETISPLEKIIASITKISGILREIINKIDLITVSDSAIDDLRSHIQTLFQERKYFLDCQLDYQTYSSPLIQIIQAKADKQGRTEGWQDLIDLIASRDFLLDWLIDKKAKSLVDVELSKIIGEIDSAKAQVLDEKFEQLGFDIARWWELLRPDEPTYFDKIQRGGTGRRYIDFKARLASGRGKNCSSTLRDAVAVFSDSQLNCLGLSAFIARAIREGTGFIILDDPVPASDVDHRAMFIRYVLQELLNCSFQVILLTHDEKMWKEVSELYDHLDIDTFIITMDDPSVGAKIENRSDTLDAMLVRAKTYIESNNPEVRKIGAKILRDAAERFCKLMIVQDQQKKGNKIAGINDHSGKTLGKLFSEVLPMLTDPSHPGKLRTIAMCLNPAAHDDIVPTISDLRGCFSDLKNFRDKYINIKI